MRKIIAVGALWLYSFTAMADGNNPDFAFIERKKTIVKAFNVQPNEVLSIDNRMGDVKVELWEKPSLRVEITITANAPTEERLEAALRSVRIEEKKDGNQISLQTVIASGRSSSWSNRKGENSIRIDYAILMPKQMPLQLKNAFGNTDIAHFHAPLTLESSYGSFTAKDLASIANNLVILYGKAAIEKIETAKLESKYSKVNLQKVNSLELINKFGPLTIGEVGSLIADIDYSGAKIGSLTQSGTVKLSYSDQFTISSSTANHIDIQAAYSTVVIPSHNPTKFDVSVTYGDFQYPKGADVLVNKKSINKQTKQYEGSVGTPTPASTIKVTSKYGNVRMKD
jgi:hypothetical protein